MTARALEYTPLDDMIPALVNPKRHQDLEIQASLRRWGYTEPVLRDERTGRMIAGHGRLENLQFMRSNGEEPPQGVLVTDDGRWTLPVITGWSSRDDREAEAYIVASNRLVEVGGWDDNILVDMMQGAELEGTGFRDGDIDDLLAKLEAEIVLPPGGTDAQYADLPPARKGEPPPPREAQGLREVVLLFHVEHHREYMELLPKLKRVWREETAALTVLKAMREAAEGL